MITIYCALYAEAQYLIQHYELKKATESRHFQIFFNEKRKIRLVITGVGKLNATVAMAEISTIYPPAEEDLMVNYGSCAAEGMLMPGEGKGGGGACVSLGSIIMVNKLTDAESGRTFYPDMIYRHPFTEGEVKTSVHVYTADEGTRDEEQMKMEAAGQTVQNEGAMRAETTGQTVHDMEAVAFYEAGNFYYGPHQMIFLKVVTDLGIEKDHLQNDLNQENDIGNEKNTTINPAASERERFVMIMQEAGAECNDHCRNRYTDPAFPIVEDWIRTADRCNAQICGTGVPVINSAFCSIGSTWYYQSLILMCIKSPIRFSLYP